MPLILGIMIACSSSPAQEMPTQQPLTDFSKLKDGDMVFIESSTTRADAIKKLSKSIFSHCGIVFKKGDKTLVYEGAGRQKSDPVTIQEWQIVESTPAGESAPPPSKYHPVYARRHAGLTNDQVAALKAKAEELHHTKYDHAFQFGNTYTEKENGTPKEYSYIYCSELNYLAFKSIGIELGTPKAFKDYYTVFGNGQAEIDKVKAMMKKELNDKARAREVRNPPDTDFNENDTVISPADVYRSTKLEDVK